MEVGVYQSWRVEAEEQLAVDTHTRSKAVVQAVQMVVGTTAGVEAARTVVWAASIGMIAEAGEGAEQAQMEEEEVRVRSRTWGMESPSNCQTY